ncbi:unnamed protein product [Microthlaspi erraticum]|uniref:Uncharacterized protein n=1 Tax=Microthlaspi erraticum TaxID=1685480 RepID=A0A6D2JNS6_9BRAS|nr:unnamed protein product [Microthlaspi erraticum]
METVEEADWRANKDNLEESASANNTYSARIKPKVPYPGSVKKPKKEKEQAKLKDLVSQLSVRLPFVDACMIIPSLRKYMKSILTSNLSLEEGVMLITEDCSLALKTKPRRSLNPGSFVLSCQIGSLNAAFVKGLA